MVLLHNLKSHGWLTPYSCWAVQILRLLEWIKTVCLLENLKFLLIICQIEMLMPSLEFSEPMTSILCYGSSTEPSAGFSLKVKVILPQLNACRLILQELHWVCITAWPEIPKKPHEQVARFLHAIVFSLRQQTFMLRDFWWTLPYEHLVEEEKVKSALQMGCCVSSFSIAVTKYSRLGTLYRGEVFLACSTGGCKVK